MGPDRQGLVSQCSHFGCYFDWEGHYWMILGGGKTWYFGLITLAILLRII